MLRYTMSIHGINLYISRPLSPYFFALSTRYDWNACFGSPIKIRGTQFVCTYISVSIVIYCLTCAWYKQINEIPWERFHWHSLCSCVLYSFCGVKLLLSSQLVYFYRLFFDPNLIPIFQLNTHPCVIKLCDWRNTSE